MSDSPDAERQTNAQHLQQMLVRTAVEDRPRMFTIFGTYHGDPLSPIIGWGMEFANDGGTIYSGIGQQNVHSAESAEQVLELHSMIADVQLKWLDT